MDPRENSLPKWARELIDTLRKRVQYASEDLTKEITQLRPKVQLLERKLAALEDLLTCASKGGHLTSQAVIEVLESYSLTLTKEE